MAPAFVGVVIVNDFLFYLVFELLTVAVGKVGILRREKGLYFSVRAALPPFLYFVVKDVHDLVAVDCYRFAHDWNESEVEPGKLPTINIYVFLVSDFG